MNPDRKEKKERAEIGELVENLILRDHCGNARLDRGPFGSHGRVRIRSGEIFRRGGAIFRLNDGGFRRLLFGFTNK